MKKPGRRIALLTAAAVGMLGVGLASTTSTANAATPACQVDYTITSESDGAFSGNIAVTNLGARIDDWALTWGVVAGQEFSRVQNASIARRGTRVTATSAGRKATLATGSKVAFDFSGSWTANNPVPNTFALNGVPCSSRTITGGTAGVRPAPTYCPPTASAARAQPSTVAARSVAGSAAAAAPPIKIWMAGDSTMANASTCPIGWGSQFGALFTSAATVVNRAVAGRSIQTWLYDPNVTTTANSAGECVISPNTYSTRWQDMLNTSTGMKAGDYLFIQFGINDGAATCARHVSPARYQALLTVMAKAALARGAHPVFLTPVAAITCSGSTAVKNRGFVTQTFAAGTANGVPVIDLQTLSLALYNSLKFCPNNGDYTKGAVGAFFCNDHTHFEAAGARQIAAVVASALRNQGIPVASYLR
jgi:lysophospholipase L1-like esterase